MNRYEKLLIEKESLEKKIAINQERVKRSMYSRNERKARTHRLIQKGALLEKYFDIEHLSIQETEDFLKIFSNFILDKTPDKYKKKN